MRSLSRVRVLAALGLAAAGTLTLVGCSQPTESIRDTALEGLRLTEVAPGTILPGTVVAVHGQNFTTEEFGSSSLRLQGTINGEQVDRSFSLEFVSFEEMTFQWDGEGPMGDFVGDATLQVLSLVDGQVYQSPSVDTSLTFVENLVPEMNSVQDGIVFVNDDIAVNGTGFLFGGDEGATLAEVTGCFTPEGELDCAPVAPVIIPVDTDGLDRTQGTFDFSPKIAGLGPGDFEGNVSLYNEYPAGSTFQSEISSVTYFLQRSRLDAFQEESSLGAFVDIEGRGFVGPGDGLTTVQLEGTYKVDDALEGFPVSGPVGEIVPNFVDGGLLRYVIDEQDNLGVALEAAGGNGTLRQKGGTFEGTVRTIVAYEDEVQEGDELEVFLRLEPVKQVVWIRFLPSYRESLRTFGLRAVDSLIRDRIMEVLERDYKGVNIEFRLEQPTDFALYSTVDLAGPDPNGIGLLGFDNTPGKDINNERLSDQIGGVNAATQEDGSPGYGGVFVESFFVFSGHPPNGNAKETAVESFDQLFDPFRPDRGDPVRAADLANGVATLSSGQGCPTAGGDRSLQISCAIWAFGSMVGTTVSHEIGHSLGLAPPGDTMVFHNGGNTPRRLMNSGSNRPFEERAEILGTQPGAFCQANYDYLRFILPSNDPPDNDGRPPC